MKRSTCILLLCLAGLWFMITIFADKGSTSLFAANIPAIILVIIAITKWNSEEEYRDIKEAQIEALKRGNVNVDLTGKMKKLK